VFGITFTIILAGLTLVGLAYGSGPLSALGIMGIVVATGFGFWGRIAPQNLIYERSLSQSYAFFDEELELTISISNAKPTPVTWVEIQDDFPEQITIIDKPLKASSKPGINNLFHRISLGPYERISWHYRVRCGQRGAFQIGPAVIKTGDPFALFPKILVVPQKTAVLVYPKVIPLPPINLEPKNEFGNTTRRHQLSSDIGTVSGHRDYEVGDPIKLIDWKASARHQKVQVKVLEPDASPMAVPLVNFNTLGSAYAGYIPKNFERLLTLAASITWSSLSHGQSIGVITNGKSVLYERPMSVRPGRNPKQLGLILETLAMAAPFEGSPIDTELLRAARNLPPGATLLLITSVMTPHISNALTILAGQNRAPRVLWVADWAPDGIPDEVPFENLAPYLSELETHDLNPV